ncbi:LuxR C-terminal-related transcriptional regulator [Pseudomonas nitroreducens]|uniref:LuxR C-terminal-related transcriptional regulator n=1 Tax=Pseudomonas nitroreducens TaxID=46680 RepID=UPI002D7FC8AE|nr:LuxR C-terminal-related transcriptional regulator [Pseudomonas nitroreducens]
MHPDKLLVTTKLAPPRVSPNAITRQRLLEQLQRMEHCTVGVVIGGPGFGKTTLLVQWRQTMLKARAEVAWLTLSTEDRHLASFFVYLRAALNHLGIALENDIPLEGASGESLDGLVASIVEGAAAVSKQLYLVLDDYHLVSDSRAHRLVQRLLDHCPQNLHFIIASRADPPLSLSRLRLQDQVLELDCAGLPFDLAETRSFLETNLPSLKLSSEESHLIQDLTSGWPASLQLIVLLLRARPEARNSLRDLGWMSDDLQTYLAEDVMVHLPPELAGFMERVSLCRRFNASLAAHLTGHDNAGELLARMEEENLLVFRIVGDDRQPWYRFHPLFGEFLAARLERRDPTLVNDLHRRAARWFAERKLLAEGLRHATESGDLEFAAEVVERSAPTSWGLDQVGPLLRLLDRLPQETLFSHPRLFFRGCLAYALTARPAKAESWLEEYKRSGASQEGDLLQHLRLVQASIAIQRDRTDQIVSVLEGAERFDDDYSVVRYGPSALLAIAYAAEGRHIDALRYLDEHPIAEADRNDEMALVVEGARTLCHLLEGRMADALRVGQDLFSRSVSAHGHRSASAYLCAASLAVVYCELDRIDEAREVLANRVGLLQWAMPDTMIRGTICRARLDLLQESAAAALAFLERQERHFRSIGLERGIAHSLAEQLRIRLLEGDGDGAQACFSRLEPLEITHQGERGFLSEIPMLVQLSRGRLALAAGEHELAQTALEAVREYAQALGRGQLEVTALLLMALGRSAQRQQVAAESLLVEALQLGRRGGLVRTFVDEGAGVVKLLSTQRARQSSQGDVTAYLDDLLARFRREEVTDRASLSPRELAIIQLVAQAMSNKRIALTLNISQETVKWNLKNVYAKLGVSSRYDAMSWARKHGLIR